MGGASTPWRDLPLALISPGAIFDGSSIGRDRDAALAVAKHLKSAGERYKNVFIEKDVHPSVREEWKRL